MPFGPTADPKKPGDIVRGERDFTTFDPIFRDPKPTEAHDLRAAPEGPTANFKQPGTVVSNPKDKPPVKEKTERPTLPRRSYKATRPQNE